VASGRVTLRAPMPGRVVAVRHAIGDAVRERATVIVIEAMKMEHAVASPIAGRLAGLDVAIGQQVERGQPLAEVAESGGVADERP